MYTQKTFVLKPADVQKKWHIIDASGMVVGRLATEVATLLRGKRNPQFTLHTDSGDYVIVINAEKVIFTGNKLEDKIYYTHSNHISGLKQRTAREQFEKNPTAVLGNAVKGMLPKNTLGRKQLTKLKLFVGDKHTHEAQNPEVYTF